MHRLYDDLVELYDLVSDPRQYADEARQIRTVLHRALRRSPGRRKPALLELGVGAGHVLSHLTKAFRATAVDLAPDMLKMSRRLNPSVEHHRGDMRTVRLRRTFDVVLIHDAIHYMLTEDDLLAALRTAADHLRPGGVGLFIPGYVRETYIDGDVSHLLQLSAADRLGYVAQTEDANPRDTKYNLIFLLFTRQRKAIRVHEEVHACGLFPMATWMRLLAEAGFDTKRPRIIRGSKSRQPPPQTPMFVGHRR